MKNKLPITKLKAKAWNLFSKYIRYRDCYITTNTYVYGVCYTCEKEYPFNKLQAGHFVDSRTKPVLFNPDIVKAQCMQCNVLKKGNKDFYTPKMIAEYGQDRVLEFLELRHNKDKKWSREELEEVIDKYQVYVREYEQLAREHVSISYS